MLAITGQSMAVEPGTRRNNDKTHTNLDLFGGCEIHAVRIILEVGTARKRLFLVNSNRRQALQVLLARHIGNWRTIYYA